MPSQNVDKLVRQKLINSQAKIHAVWPSVICLLKPRGPIEALVVPLAWVPQKEVYLERMVNPLSRITAVQRNSPCPAATRLTVAVLHLGHLLHPVKYSVNFFLV